MSLFLFDNKGTPVGAQKFTWRDLVGNPISKLDDDAFTRIRVILAGALEQESLRFSHACARMNEDLRVPLAEVRRVEQHQATMLGFLIGSDHSPLETTIAGEQAAIEVTAAAAQKEPDPYLAQTFRFGMLEDFDHLFRFSALLDRLEGKDANNILQCYTDILPGRPSVHVHRAARDDLRMPYDRQLAAPLSKLHVLTLLAAQQRAQDHYLHVGPLFADPMARQLYAEVASIKEQHVTQYESLIDPEQTWIESWLLHEAAEVYLYYGCAQQEVNPRLRELWTRFCDYELGQLHHVCELLRQAEGRDPGEILPQQLPEPIHYASQRDFVRKTLMQETDLRANGSEYVGTGRESPESMGYRDHVNSGGSPSESVALGYRWQPGTELSRKAANS